MALGPSAQRSASHWTPERRLRSVLCSNRMSLRASRPVTADGLPARGRDGATSPGGYRQPAPCAHPTVEEAGLDGPDRATMTVRMNRLANATSPSLLQHASNPGEWWPSAPGRRGGQPQMRPMSPDVFHGRVGPGGAAVVPRTTNWTALTPLMSGRSRRHLRNPDRDHPHHGPRDRQLGAPSGALPEEWRIADARAPHWFSVRPPRRVASSSVSGLPASVPRTTAGSVRLPPRGCGRQSARRPLEGTFFLVGPCLL